MLEGIFLVFLFQLIGEVVQKFFSLTIPGPVIGLVLLLISLLLTRNTGIKPVLQLRENLSTSADAILKHLPLLFVPVGVGVVTHISLLESSLLAVLAVIFVATVLTIGVTALAMERMQKARPDNDG